MLMEKIKNRISKIRQEKILPRRRYLIFMSIFLIGAAFLLTLALEYRYFSDNFGRTWQFVFERPLVFLYNAFLMFWILLLVVGLTRRPWLTLSMLLSIIWILGYVQISKQAMRGTPLLPEDFQLASEVSSLTKFVDWGGIIKLLITIAAFCLAGWFLGRKTKKIWKLWEKPESLNEAKSLSTKKVRRKKITALDQDEVREIRREAWLKNYAVLQRVIIALIACLGFLISSDFVRNHQGTRYQRVDFLQSEFVAWNQTRNYDYNGFILGFLYNWGKFKLEAPAGYSQGKIAKIADKYNQKKQMAEYDAETKTHKKSSLKDADYNIVMVLNESFYDPEIIAKYYPHTGGDVTPNWHKITKQHSSGMMYSLGYGGGTANIEFEVLTGLSNYWANTVPYTDLLPRTGKVPSLASLAKQNGYQTTAIHPFNGGMYKRNIALKNEGFDNFITELEMKHTEHTDNSQYINDRAAYNEVLEVLKAKQKQMVGLITMQNHSPYYNGIYKEKKFKVTSTEDDDWTKEQVENYLQTLHYSDQYLGEFLAKLDQSKEKTVVLFFGDHSPGVFPRVNDHAKKEVRDLARLTPYFVYANFKMEKAEPKLPTTTPNCLTNTMLNGLNVKKPAMFYLLDEICKETPILTPNYFGEKAPFQSTKLSSYELLNYDILGGKKYWLELGK